MVSALYSVHAAWRILTSPRPTSRCRQPDGGPLRHSNWYPRHFKPAVVRAGLPNGTRFHDLRHTYAAFLIAEGAHSRAMMERMGHSSINVTLGTYGHLFPSIDEQIDAALDRRYENAGSETSATLRALGTR